MNKLILYPAFIGMILLQLYIPFQMVMRNESILKGGKEFKFKTAPVDPMDPFRGKYITLSFEATSFRTTDTKGWSYGEPVYVGLGTDDKGFAEIQSLSRVEPTGTTDYVKASVQYTMEDSISYVTVAYPFDRFYMEESKASGAEQVYGETARDTNQVAYALVSIKDGEAVVKDVMINDVPIREVVKRNQQNIQ